jgi:hypothetical protein
MTWAEFNTLVRTHLTQYARVQGVQDWIDLLIKAAAHDLQRTIEFYRDGHTDVLAAADLVADGFAQRGDVPAGKWVSAKIVKYADAALVEDEFDLVEQVPWTYTQAMRAGLVNDMPVLAVDDNRREFLMTPALNDESRLVIEWNGVKTDFADLDTVPFDDKFAEACAEYVLARVVRRVDHDPATAASYAQSYALLKRQLLSDSYERGRLNKQG